MFAVAEMTTKAAPSSHSIGCATSGVHGARIILFLDYWASRIRPMSIGVYAANNNPFRIPPEIRPHVRSAITQSQSAPPSIRIVNFRPVQRQVAMDRNLSCAQNVVNRGAEPFDIGDGLVKHVVFVVLAQTPGQMAVQVRAGNEAHAGVFRISVVDRKPYRDGLRWRQRPVARVLMPAHSFTVARHLTEIMRSPPDHVLAKQVFDDGDDARAPEQIVYLRVFQMSRADRITVAPGGADPFEQAVEVMAVRADLVFIEDRNAFEKTLAVELRDLLSPKSGRIVDSQRVKAQVSLDLLEFFVLGNDFELGCLSHQFMTWESDRIVHCRLTGARTMVRLCVTKPGDGALLIDHFCAAYRARSRSPERGCRTQTACEWPQPRRCSRPFSVISVSRPTG